MPMVIFKEELKKKAWDPKAYNVEAIVSRDELPDARVIFSMQQLHGELESSRIKREKDLNDSLEFAKHYTCK